MKRNLGSMLVKGMAALERSDYLEAFALAGTLLDEQPQHWQALTLRVDAAASLGLDDVVLDLVRLVKSADRRGKLLNRAIVAAARSSNLSAACEFHRRAEAAETADFNSARVLAAAACDSRRYDIASEILASAYFDRVQRLVIRADVFASRGRYEEAIDVLESIDAGHLLRRDALRLLVRIATTLRDKRALAAAGKRLIDEDVGIVLRQAFATACAAEDSDAPDIMRLAPWRAVRTRRDKNPGRSRTLSSPL